MLRSTLLGTGLLVVAQMLGSSSPGQAAEQRLVLVKEGMANCVIVVGSHAPTPNYSALPAARLLQRYLEKISGAKVPVVAEQDFKPEDASKKVLILVGDGRRVRSLGLSRRGLHPEGFLIKSMGNHLVILGGDAQTLQGSRYGTLALLERYLGVRWLMPFDVGEVVPRRRTVALPPIKFRDQPKFAVRHIRNGYDNGGLWQVSRPYMGDEKRHQQLAGRATQWYALQRLAFGVKLNGAHADESFHQRFGQAHPEWFAMQPDGRRFVPKRSAAYAKLCVSNPALIQQKVADARAELKKNPQLDSIAVSPNDGANWGYCMCPECKKWDDPRGQKFTFVPSYGQPTFTYVSLADRYARYYSAIATQLAPQYPKVLVVGMAYGHYTPPPLRTKVHPNVVIEYVGASDYSYDRDRAATRKELLGWGKAGAQLAWRPNWMRQDGWPYTHPHRLAEDIRAYYRLGMRYGDFDTFVNDWGAGGLNCYVLARLLWDPELDVDRLIDDYCQTGFGPAAAAMKRYFARLEATSVKMSAGADPRQPWYYEAARYWTPPFFRAALGDLHQADRLAARSADPAAVRRRVALFREAMEWTQLHVEMVMAVRALREKRGGRAACQALVAKRDQWYRDHLYTEALPVPYIRWQDARFKVYLEP